MNNIVSFLFLYFLSGACVYSTQPPIILSVRMHPNHYLGESAPDFSVPDESGTMHTLSSYRGKKVLLLFFHYNDDDLLSANSGETREHLKCINELLPVFSVNNIIVLGASNACLSNLQTLKNRLGIKYPLLPATTHSVAGIYAASEYGHIIRTSYLIDEHGFVIKTIQHHDPWKHVGEMLIFMLTQGVVKNDLPRYHPAQE